MWARAGAGDRASDPTGDCIGDGADYDSALIEQQPAPLHPADAAISGADATSAGWGSRWTSGPVYGEIFDGGDAHHGGIRAAIDAYNSVWRS